MQHEDMRLVEAAKREPVKYEALYTKYADHVFNIFLVSHRARLGAFGRSDARDIPAGIPTSQTF